ncbi:hypothetical protein U1737_20460 [Sphingomonas sp. LB3N6]|uniref:hypothetical protein n=1 Tax=Sphingomonas fucosidasi TaxID=3096164 RepID=UPI002FC96669
MSDLTQQLQNAIVVLAFRERFDDLSGLFKAIGSVCHTAKMVHPAAIGNEQRGERRLVWSPYRIKLPAYGRTFCDRAHDLCNFTPTVIGRLAPILGRGRLARLHDESSNRRA